MTSKAIVETLLSHGTPPRPPVMPITMMFAADLFQRPYRDYVTDFRVLAEAQLRTAERFGFDYVSAISDPAREASDFGASVRFFQDQPPVADECNALLADKTVLARLKLPDPLGGGRMHDRIRGVERLRQRVGDSLLVEGWVEGPCAEAADLRGINTIMTDFFDDESFIEDLFSLAVENAIAFARRQLEAGADIIGIGDAAASLVGPEIYEQFVFPYEKRLIDVIHAAGGKVRLHICGNISAIVGKMAELAAEIVDVDSMVPMAHARAATGPRQVLLGNLDPVAVVRNGTSGQIRDALLECHRAAAPNYIVGAGCEIPRGTPEANVHAFAQFAASHSPALPE
ncbi:MAG: uroporphyrinogen decarboxylase family protein [FCB group bacterium]|nr:uroporphyrinogen decarboxylase family protein [FCB group bacterium]